MCQMASGALTKTHPNNGANTIGFGKAGKARIAWVAGLSGVERPISDILYIFDIGRDQKSLGSGDFS